MLGLLKKFDGHVQAVGNRWQAYVAYVAFWGLIVSAATLLLHWARPFFPPSWGWPEATVLAIAATCILVVVISIALIAWRYFHPLRIPALEKGMSDEEPQDDPESMADLREHLDDLENRFSKIAVPDIYRRTVEIEESLSSRIELMGEALKNLDDATDANVRRISKEIQAFSDRLLWLDNDARDLIIFATDITTLTVLEKFLADGVRVEIRTGPETSLAERDECCAKAQDYIRSVVTAFSDTYRGLSINNLLRHADIDAEAAIRSTPLNERPTHIDPLDYHSLAIAEMQVKRLLAFLESQCEEKKNEIRQQRPKLLDRLRVRNPS